MDGKQIFRLCVVAIITMAICFLAWIDKIPPEATVYLLGILLGFASGFLVNGVKNKINGN